MGKKGCGGVSPSFGSPKAETEDLPREAKGVFAKVEVVVAVVEAAAT